MHQIYGCKLLFREEEEEEVRSCGPGLQSAPSETTLWRCLDCSIMSMVAPSSCGLGPAQDQDCPTSSRAVHPLHSHRNGRGTKEDCPAADDAEEPLQAANTSLLQQLG
ncbi:uncharacterized protein tafa3a isoform X2 [Pseudoliparis swirei]|uniref:uncharacterized protein tafa3a isoform X2 n=1 Tax=Pseudoliparis swirei TaxID=2059687 RepID=UPI0024BE6583|nr:uncharacterized protein tafa3a isoform X2 [Pseudoliparis swirei]